MRKTIETTVLVAAIMAVTATGCTVTRIHSEDGSGGKTSVTSYTPGWPWMDTQKALDKATLSTSTNSTSLNLAGYTEAETGNTNAMDTVQAVVGAAIGAAVKAGK